MEGGGRCSVRCFLQQGPALLGGVPETQSSQKTGPGDQAAEAHLQVAGRMGLSDKGKNDTAQKGSGVEERSSIRRAPSEPPKHKKRGV